MNGILNLHKPAGPTSFDCVAAVRRVAEGAKTGHGGTLDPMAEGVLAICVGKATRLIEYMDEDSKSYICGCRLGLRTDTLDIWGEPLSEDRQGAGKISKDDFETALQKFRGEILQTPPMYSAVSVGGKRLYQYAREGKSVEVAPRKVSVFNIDLLEWNDELKEAVFELECSRGTYVRSICGDIGELLGCGASMSSLLRTRTCGLDIEKSVPLEEVKEMSAQKLESILLPMETALGHIERLELDEDRAKRFVNGLPSWSAGLESEGLRAVFSDSGLLGTARDGKIEKVLSL